MERIKAALKKLFCLPPLLTVLIAVPSFALVAFVLATGRKDALTYAAYAFSAYALIISVTGIMETARAAKLRMQTPPLIGKLKSTPFVQRYMEDKAFRTEVALLRGLALNLIYVFIKLFSGIYYRSVWFVALSAYYLFLSVLRFLLLHHMHYQPKGATYVSELKRYRLCGWLLLALNLALSAIVTLVVVWNQGFRYSGYLIYVMAIYAFYVTITSIMNVIKFRRYNSPVLSAAKAVNLAAALVSMLSLETAMLSQFGGTGASDFRRMMTATSGFVVCAFVLSMAVYMICKASKRLKNLNETCTGLGAVKTESEVRKNG